MNNNIDTLIKNIEDTFDTVIEEYKNMAKENGDTVERYHSVVSSYQHSKALAISEVLKFRNLQD